MKNNITIKIYKENTIQSERESYETTAPEG